MNGSTIGKWTIALVVLVAAGVWLEHTMNRPTALRQYNRIIDQLFNLGKYEQAAEAFEALRRTDLRGQLRRNVKETLIKCYLTLGDEPSRPVREAAWFLKQAYQIDPDALDDVQKRAMQLPN